MLDDFTMIFHEFYELPFLNIYPLGDVHIGSQECDLELLEKWVETVKCDPNGYAVIIGDMMNMGIKNSKSNIYEELLTPAQQKQKCYEILLPIKDKILGMVSGNHEYRLVREVGTNPLYDVACRLGIEDLYRENAAFIKLTVGKKGRNPNTYAVVLTHGASKSKDESWTYTVDGADVFISGHTHEVLHKPLGKIRIDLSHNKVKTVGCHHIVVTPFQGYGGYAIRGKYKPVHLGQFQTIQFDAYDKIVGYKYY